MEINHFEGSRPEWLVHKRTLCFWQRAGLWEGERESTYWCMPAALTLYLFLSSSSNIPLPYPFSFFLFFLILVFYFLVFKFLILWCFPCPLYMARAFFYSAYRDQVLLFYSLTTFVWSGCTCRPTLVHLLATPHHQTKENSFVCLSVVAPFPATVWMPSLSLYLIACT